MMVSSTVSTLTLEELREIIRAMMHEMLQEEIELPKRSPLELPLVDVGEWRNGVELIKREDFYDDE